MIAGMPPLRGVPGYYSGVTSADSGGEANLSGEAAPSPPDNGEKRPVGFLRFGGERVEVIKLGLVLALAVAVLAGAMMAHRAPLTTVKQDGDAPLWGDHGATGILRAHGLRLLPDNKGSQQVADDPQLKNYDIAAVSSDDAAQHAVQNLKARGITTTHVSSPSNTPMVVFAYRRVARLLQNYHHIARQGPDGVWTFDMRRYSQVVQAGKRWTDIPGNTMYPSPNQILLATTDPSQSASSGSYLAVLSYMFNGNAPVTSTARADELMPRILPFFLNQGYLKPHTPDLFQAFLAGGVGRYPMFFGYEGDYLADVLSHSVKLPSDLVVMYPKPTADSEVDFVSWTTNGDKLASLAKGPAMGKLEIENGQRTAADDELFAHIMKTHGIAVPAIPDYVQPPTDAVLEHMIARISHAETGSG